MKRYHQAMLALLLLIAASSLGAQTSSDLAGSLDTHFDVQTAGALGPSMVPWTGISDFYGAAMAVRDDMTAIGGITDITCTTANSVSVRWVLGSANWTQDDAILFCTGADGNPGADVAAVITGNGSSVYAVGGSALAANNHGGEGDATNNATSTGGHCGAWGGSAAGHGTAGLADAKNYDLGPALAVGGRGDRGSGGAAAAQSELEAVAWGGHSAADPTLSFGNGGFAVAISSASTAEALGGHTTYGLGGNARAWGDFAGGATLAAVAKAGNSAEGGGGGWAEAEANGPVEAYGGTGTSNAGGGDAWAVSFVSDALARGGDAEDSNAGSALAEADGDAIATGGSVTGTGNGGDAEAISTSGDATAPGGDTDDGDGGAAIAEGDGDAVATGGDTGDGDGGTADATAASGDAEAHGGHSAGTGAGGLATAIGDTSALAIGGDSDGTVGGAAYAEADGPAEAYGGQGTSSADGGMATAISDSDDALAMGGDADDGNGGDAEATSDNDAEARGGHALNAILNSLGGMATATVVPGGTGDADAFGGSGNEGGLAVAMVSSSGSEAYARGGNGILDPQSTQSLGGQGRAESTVSGGQATADGGDANCTTGVGGDATATDSSQTPSVIDSDSNTGCSGGHASVVSP